jgi:hypothetical protein
VAGIATTCEAASDFAESLARCRVDRTLATDPLGDRSYRLNIGRSAPGGAGMVQLDDSRRSVLASPDASEVAAFIAGPYMAYRLTSNLLLDAKAAWGTAHDSAI